MFIVSGRILGDLGKEPHLRTTREEHKVIKLEIFGKINRSGLEENQTLLGRLLVSNIVTRINYINYEI